MSPETSQWFVAGIAPMAVVITLSLLWRSRRGRARRETGSGDLVLEYGAGIKSIPVLVTIAWAILIPIVLHDDPIQRENLFAFLLFVVFITVPLVVTSIEAYGVGHRIKKEGIEKRTPWSNQRLVKWENVSEIAFSPLMQWFVVRSPECNLRLHLYLNGLRDFADAVRERVPRERWVKAEPQLNNLISK